MIIKQITHLLCEWIRLHLLFYTCCKSSHTVVSFPELTSVITCFLWMWLCVIFHLAQTFLLILSCQIGFRDATVPACIDVIVEPSNRLFASHLVWITMFWWYFLRSPAMGHAFLEYSYISIWSSFHFTDLPHVFWVM